MRLEQFLPAADPFLYNSVWKEVMNNTSYVFKNPIAERDAF